MSYAGRLIAMARGEVPRVAPTVRDGVEAVREDHVETASPPPASPIAAVQVMPARRSPAVPSAAPGREPARETETRIEQTHEIATASPSPMSPPPIEVHVHESVPAVERVVLPAAPRWLADDPSAPDPLVATADTDALRELMRSVRQWTASPPTIMETPEPAKPAEAKPVIETAPAAEPVQVTIGNVVVTVEDAPAASPRGRSPSPARSAGDRLARNYIRGT